MDSIQLKLCDIQGRLFDIQGRLFERSTAYASEGFLRDFMNSEVAEHLDSPYNKLPWMGEEYLMDELKDKDAGYRRRKILFGSAVLDWVSVPLLGLYTRREEQENLPPGSGKNHETKLCGFSHV